MIELEKLTEFAKKARAGFSCGKTTAKTMQLSNAEVQYIRRRKKKDGCESYDDAFYIASLCLGFLLRTFEERKLREKISSFSSKNSSQISEAVKIADFDFVELIEELDKYLGQKVESDLDIDEDIFYCASFVVISRIGKDQNFDKNIFYTLLNFLSM